MHSSATRPSGRRVRIGSHRKFFEDVTLGRLILAITTRNSPIDRVLARSGIPDGCIYDDSSPDEADQALLNVLSALRKKL